jgi:propionate CoA-transferase
MARVRGSALIVSAEEAIALIADGATVGVSGFVGAGHPEHLTAALEERFLATGFPQNLTLLYAAGQGDRNDRGLNHLAYPGLLKRVVGGHWNLAPKLGQMALDGVIEAYNLPQGVVCVLLREIAAHRPGVITKVGLGTFMDPRFGGGRLNPRTIEPIIELVKLDGEEWLRYKSFPIHVALIRATAADARGNLTMEDEGVIGEVLPMAQAARNSGGLVIAQVQRLVKSISDPKAVRVPGILVDYVCVAPAEHHMQTFSEQYTSAFVQCADETVPLRPLEFSERKIIGRRALQEINTGDIVNLGIGLPETVAAVAEEQGQLKNFTLTVEAGPIGGVPASGLSFGCSHYPEAIIDQPSQFDFYDGGGIDIAVLGAVEIDEEGSVNVSCFAGRFAGVGGFMNISHSARRLVFCCTFTAGGLQIESEGGSLRIRQEGKHSKFVKKVAQVSFHGPTALDRGQQVLYVTERAVFALTESGLRLIELADGIDLDSQVLRLMQFSPEIKDYQKYNAECFRNS